MPEQTPENVERTLYRKRQEVQRLRQQLYGRPGPGTAPDLLDALLAAEETLHTLEAAVSEPADDSGVLLTTTAHAPASKGVLMGTDTTGIDVDVSLRQSHVPTGVVHLLDPDEMPLVSYTVKCMSDEPVRLRLTTFVEGYSAKCIDTVELHYDESVEIRHLPTFFPRRLRGVTELTRATLHVRVDDLDGTPEQHSTFPIWLLPRTSAYLGIEDPATGAWLDLAPFLGAWVTPNAPAVMDVLREAADHHPQRAIAGYQVDTAGIEAQVRAIYGALAAAEVVYVNSVLAFGVTKGTYMQRVRLPSEALERRSANCLDGTLLMASLLEAASLNPGIVLVPGHAFLAWETQDSSGEWDYLETTMVGTDEFSAAQTAGRRLAERQCALVDRTGNARFFRRLSVPDLRVDAGITPMA